MQVNEKWEANVLKAMELTKTFSPNRELAARLMLNGPIGQQFFTAPASTKKSYHNAFTGGLLEHSLNVVDNARKIANALAPGMFSDESVVLTALFHDLGKCGDGVEPHYIQLDENDWRRRRGDLYEVNPKCDFMPTGERGVWLLLKHGFEPTYDEMMALRLNDGAGARENQPYAFREPRLALVIHWADHWSCVGEKEAWNDR